MLILVSDEEKLEIEKAAAREGVSRFGRLLLLRSGARFSDFFQRKLANGTISEPRALSSEPVWNAAIAPTMLARPQRGFSSHSPLKERITRPLVAFSHFFKIDSLRKILRLSL